MGSIMIEEVEMAMGCDKKKKVLGLESKDKTDEEKLTKSVIVKDMAIAHLGFFLNFMSIGGTTTLQSSINREGNLGTNAFTVLSIFGILSNLFLVSTLISKLGLKWSLIVSMFLRSTYPAANLHSTWYTLYPAVIVSGLVGAPLVSSFTAYLMLLSKQYAQATREPVEAATAKFFGIFFMVQRCSHLASNFVSSQIFKRPQEAHNLPPSLVESICGANYCFADFEHLSTNAMNSSLSSAYYNYDSMSNETLINDSTSENRLYQPSRNQIYLLFGLYVVASMVSGPLLILLRPIQKNINVLSKSDSKRNANTWKNLLATFVHMKKIKAILLVPLSMYIGISLSFTLTSFSLGFITCALGIDSIGYVMIVHGGAGALSAVFISGLLTQYVGRKVIFIIAACGSFTVTVAMLNWSPVSEHATRSLYIMSAIWGASSTIWLSQLSAFVGLLHANESGNAAYACHNIWQSVGLCVWQAISVHICIYVQIYIMLLVLGIGMLGYTIIEVMLYREEKLKMEEATTKL